MRGELFKVMKGKLQNLDYDIQVCNDLREMPLVKPYMKKALLQDTSISSLLSCPQEQAFYVVLTSYHWRNENIEDWVKAFAEAKEFTPIYYVLLGALTLSAMQHFSKQK